jgi:hypothetical protein
MGVQLVLDYLKLLEVANVVEDTFVRFFIADNPRFDEKRFRDACKPRR